MDNLLGGGPLRGACTLITGPAGTGKATLTQAGIAARRQMVELNLPGQLGNVMFLERPLNALSLISAAGPATAATGARLFG